MTSDGPLWQPAGELFLTATCDVGLLIEEDRESREDQINCPLDSRPRSLEVGTESPPLYYLVLESSPPQQVAELHRELEWPEFGRVPRRTGPPPRERVVGDVFRGEAVASWNRTGPSA